MKQKSRLWIWIIKQIPINYIFGIVEDAHKWQKQSLLHELEDGKSKKRNYFRVLKFASLVIAIILTVFVSTGINKDFAGYIISALSIFIGLNISLIIMLLLILILIIKHIKIK